MLIPLLYPVGTERVTVPMPVDLATLSWFYLLTMYSSVCTTIHRTLSHNTACELMIYCYAMLILVSKVVSYYEVI